MDWNSYYVCQHGHSGTPAMHRVLSKYNLITCPAKHHLKKNLDKFKREKVMFVGW